LLLTQPGEGAMLRHPDGPRAHSEGAAGLLRGQSDRDTHDHDFALGRRQLLEHRTDPLGLFALYGDLLGAQRFLGPVGQIVGEHWGSGRGALSIRDLVVCDSEDERLEGPSLVSISR
jgi:hypothetical protein